MENEEILEIGKKVLNAEMSRNDADAKTIKEYLLALAETVWLEGEGFSGKRPFGNSDWEYEIYNALAENNLIEHEFETYKYGDETYTEFFNHDIEEANKKIKYAFMALNAE